MIASVAHLNDRLIDWIVILFAGWSLTAHVTVLLGGSLVQLLGAIAIVIPVVSLLFFLVRREPHTRVAIPDDAGSRLPVEPSNALRSCFLLAAIVIICTMDLWQHVDSKLQNIVVTWHLMCAYFVAGLFFLRSPTNAPTSIRNDTGVFGVWVLAILAVGIALAAHRPNADDAIYLNMAAATADTPTLPLLARDTLHAAAETPLLLPVYRVETVNLLSGALSYLSGFEPIVFNHLWLPATAAFCCVFSLARLLRRLLPNEWFFGIFAVMLLLVASGDTPVTYGNFSFVRLQHGKAIFVTTLVPLIVFYGIAFGQQPSLRNLLHLAAAQIAAVGLTSTALWAAPALGLSAVAGTVFGHRWRAGSRVLAWGVVGCLYPLVLALWLRTETSELISKVQSSPVPGGPFNHAFERQFGTGPMAYLSIFWVLAAWILCATNAARRFAVVTPLLFLLVLFNPYLAPHITANLMPEQVYWRAFWVLPLPVLCGVALVAPLEAGNASRWLRWIITTFPFVFAAIAFESGIQTILSGIAELPSLIKALLGGLVAAGLVLAAMATWGSVHTAHVRGWAGMTGIVILFVILPARSILSDENGVRIKLPPAIKVDPAYGIAKYIASRLSPSDTVLAPEPVSVWLAGIRRAPRSICVRGSYIRYLQAHLGRQEAMRRLALKDFVSGTLQLKSPETFRASVDLYDLRAVCLNGQMPQLQEAQNILADAAFSLAGTFSTVEIWIRSIEPDVLPISVID